ncbi:GNAT family N-acetyltransferase [Pseudomonas gingeri]|uniref:GNAT family N-acetyltransferase n=1 Tax=Pseudomonas gingeri TaxID=117681 RepID=UPI0015A16124|nr:GNAT family N-acetyltransferase [Pseudomonas gingeri]NWA00118.1 GNAT family N-acetyltransferase [Pseudomonas gingeri]NWA16957.1 GNAT family N-acetyltransferase [Pseudomonas gingeri]NWA53657.1 GNAT family N-acetyltransferase [Pseudomonas gingeri]NWA93889.1 GNAT family N-acetyltransferase [Pseudomonas gingeri]NWB02211.1 GNAT family N-acetyltransferase [Pseudomonas gingeri]
MDTSIEVGPAVVADAGIISRILIGSIKVGCSLDHRNEPSRVEAWTRGRSVDHVLPWLSDPRLRLSLARLQGKPVGVGMARADGCILLCYVLPQWFRRGVGRALLAQLEAWLAAVGHETVRLNSTRTGLGFYHHLGYRQAARAFSVGGLMAIPMKKLLIQLPDGSKSPTR